MSTNYGEHFDDLAKAIESLEVFPQVIVAFTTFLKERYKKKHTLADLRWITKLCSGYEDKCKQYVKFIKRVVVKDFLAECMKANDIDGKTEELIKELRENIGFADKNLDKFLGNGEETKEFVSKLDTEFAKMEKIQLKEETTKNMLMKFSGWCKEEVGKQGGDVVAKIAAPLFDFLISNLLGAIDSGYSFNDLKEAVKRIEVDKDRLEESRDKNKRALEGVVLALDAFENMLKHKEDDLLRREMRSLYDKQGNVKKACDYILEEIAKIS